MLAQSYNEPIIYSPSVMAKPPRLLKIESAWEGLEQIIISLIRDFNLPVQSCLEFGVEFGYSTVAFSHFFKKVVGVDTFEGDVHTAHKGNHYESTKKVLSVFKNIELHKSDYRDWIKEDTNNYDLIHVDIIHTYEDTYECGLWGAQHSKCTIFHDTESFPDVKKAVKNIAQFTGKRFLNYPFHYGLGIII